MIKPNLSISSRFLASVTIVYGWRRKGKYLYIGMSVRGLSRPIQRDHHVFKKHGPFLPGDHLDIWLLRGADEAVALEGDLIAILKPPFNISRKCVRSKPTPRVKESRTCGPCGYTWKSSGRNRRCPLPNCRYVQAVVGWEIRQTNYALKDRPKYNNIVRFPRKAGDSKWLWREAA